MPTDLWDPRAAPAGSPIGYPALTSVYPQLPSPPSVPAYTDPVSRPVPTLASLSPNTIDDAVAFWPVVVTVTGTLFTPATRLSFGGVIDNRIQSIQYVSPTSIKATINVVGLAPGTYPVLAINQDGGTSTPAVNYTVT
jgi:hypothetical protein